MERRQSAVWDNEARMGSVDFVKVDHIILSNIVGIHVSELVFGIAS
jgi:hypothetical protein